MQDNDKQIILFTNSFPYGNSEPYLLNELEVYNSLKLTISIVPLNIPLESTYLNKFMSFDVINITFDDYQINKIRFIDKLFLFKIYLEDFVKSRNLNYFNKNYKHNYSLLLRLYFKAIKVNHLINLETKHTTVYSYWSNELATVACFLKRLNKNTKAISRAHGFDVFRKQTSFNHLPFKVFQLRNLNKLVAVSKAGESELKMLYPEFAEKISYSYLGVRNEGINPYNPNELNIVTCSVIREIKRLHLLADALYNCKSKITWHIIGDGPSFDDLKNHCADIPKNIRVIFYGYLSQKDINDFYRQQSVSALISLSRSEGLPVSMMEAISFGIPLISTDVGGCNEIVNNVTGLLIKHDFTCSELTSIIDNFQNSVYSSLIQRNKIKEFWVENFEANKNYKNFINVL